VFLKQRRAVVLLRWEVGVQQSKRKECSGEGASARCALTLRRSVKGQRRFQQVNQEAKRGEAWKRMTVAHNEEVEAHGGEDKMDTEGHRQGPRGDCKKMSIEEIYKELKETNEELDRLMMKWKSIQ
jgi:hypothetical protein